MSIRSAPPSDDSRRSVDSAPPAPGSSSPPTANGAARRNDTGTLVAALILVGLGLFFLVANVLPGAGNWLFIALGVVFLVTRVATGQYGLAVPSGILLGFGSFVVLNQARVLPGESGGWFFVLLGAGFLATYVLGGQPARIWPLLPAAILAAFGVILLGWFAFQPLAQYVWVANYWPVVLIVIGIWLLLRQRVPPAARRTLGVLFVVALGLYAIVALGALAAAGATRAPINVGPGIQVAVPGVAAPLTTMQELSIPLGSGDRFVLANSSGRNTVRPGTDGQARVVATKHYWDANFEPEVLVTEGAGQVRVETRAPVSSGFPFFGIGSGRIDYVVELPANSALEVRSSSGSVDVSGLAGPVQIVASSGDVQLRDLSGTTEITTSSGDVRLADVAGELRLRTSSGDVEGRNLSRFAEATTSSGRVDLRGVFREDARIRTSSGNVTVAFEEGRRPRWTCGPAAAPSSSATWRWTICGRIRAA